LTADGRITTEAKSNSKAAPKTATTLPTPAAAISAASTTSGLAETPAERAAAAGVTLPPRRENRNVVKRRVVKKGFYSDEEDESAEEEIFADTLASTNGPLSSTLRQQNVMKGGSMENIKIKLDGSPAANPFDEEETDLDDDHRILLRSAMSLLKSRNAGVVLAVCSLQYYCGVSSIPVRKAMGKALVRIHRAKHREIQYVVLTSIRKLVQECPSAFSPFLHDFFVLPDMDPPFTRLIKLDILTSLALDPPSITTVLKELRTYVQLHHNSDEYTDDDTSFVCAAVRAVGRVTEMARIVFARHGRSAKQYAEADTIALNCLYGLVTLSQTADHELIVGETVTVMQRILNMLQSDGKIVQDPNQVQDRALRRILLLLVNTLSCLVEDDEGENAKDLDDDADDADDAAKLDQGTLVLPPSASAAALWLVGEYLAPLSSNGSSSFGKFDSQDRPKVRLELARLLVRCFLELDVSEKEQAIHFASKLLLCRDESIQAQEGPLCEQVLAMGRVDNNPDVRDRARVESGVIHRTVGLQHDQEALDEAPMHLHNAKQLTLEDAKNFFLSTKPASSYLPLKDENSSRGGSMDHSGSDGDGCFRFGTLSSLVGHRARSAYMPLPPWAAKNSPSTLREPPEEKRDEQPASNDQGYMRSKEGGFYRSSDDDEDSSSSESLSSDSKSGSDSSDDSSSETGTDDDGSSSDVQREGVLISGALPSAQPMVFAKRNGSSMQQQPNIQVEIASDESSFRDSDSDDSSKESKTSAEELFPNSSLGTLIPLGGNTSRLINTSSVPSVSNDSSVVDDMKGLVLAPVVANSTEPTDSNFDRDSGGWIPLIRPDHSGGLLAEVRYLRGATKAQQAQMMGLTSEKPTIVCIQIRFENQKQQGGASIRHIRIFQRASTSSGTAIGARKVVLPLEISELPAGRRAECIVGIDFSSASDREGSLQAKLEIKFGSGGTAVEIRPTIGDLLLPCQRSVDEFDAAVSRMQGFNRAESTFSVSESSRSAVPMRLLSRAALTIVGASKQAWDESNGVRLVGTLPASSDPVYVLATCTNTGQGKIIVCCEHTLVANSIINGLKRAITD
jgi:AP-3 complex subunit beta